jgi:hypothetical protein
VPWQARWRRRICIYVTREGNGRVISSTAMTRYHKYARVGTYHNIQTTKKGGRQNKHQNDGIVYIHGGTNSADLMLAV